MDELENRTRTVLNLEQMATAITRLQYGKSERALIRHFNGQTTEIYIHSIDESVRMATDKIQGKFTPKNTYPQASATSINKKGVTAGDVTP